MLCDRLRGVLKQYPNPEVALYTTEIALGNDRSSYLVVQSQDLMAGRPMEGRAQLLADVADLETSLTAYLEKQFAACTWYTSLAGQSPALAVESPVQAIVPWIARVVNVWLKKRKPLPPPAPYEEVRQRHYPEVDPRTPRQMHEIIAETQRLTRELLPYYGEMARLARKIIEIADWARATRPNLMALTPTQVLYRVSRWHTKIEKVKIEKERPESPVVFTSDHPPGGWIVQDLTTREALEHEGRAQRHCSGKYGYWDDVCAGRTRIYSLLGGKRKVHATVEIRDGGVRQIKGFANRELTDASDHDTLVVLADFFWHLKDTGVLRMLDDASAVVTARVKRDYQLVMGGKPDGGEPATEKQVSAAVGRLLIEPATSYGRLPILQVRPPMPKTEEEVQRLYKYGFLNLHAASGLLAAMKRKKPAVR